MKHKILWKIITFFCKPLIPYIDDMQRDAENCMDYHCSCEGFYPEEHLRAQGMIDAYNNIRSLITNPAFARGYEWSGDDNE